jgi:hypothetical protein
MFKKYRLIIIISLIILTIVSVISYLIILKKPIPIKTNKIGNYNFSIWDDLSINNMKLSDAITYIENKINCTHISVSSISCGNIMLYSNFFNNNTKDERKNTNIIDLYKNFNNRSDNKK